MENIMQCVIPSINCLSESIGVIGSAMGIVFMAMGILRTFIKPIQPFLLKLVDMGPLANVNWDNKLAAGIAWFTDYFFSLKLKDPRNT